MKLWSSCPSIFFPLLLPLLSVSPCRQRISVINRHTQSDARYTHKYWHADTECKNMHFPTQAMFLCVSYVSYVLHMLQAYICFLWKWNLFMSRYVHASVHIRMCVLYVCSSSANTYQSAIVHPPLSLPGTALWLVRLVKTVPWLVQTKSRGSTKACTCWLCADFINFINRTINSSTPPLHLLCSCFYAVMPKALSPGESRHTVCVFSKLHCQARPVEMCDSKIMEN